MKENVILDCSDICQRADHPSQPVRLRLYSETQGGWSSLLICPSIKGERCANKANGSEKCTVLEKLRFVEARQPSY